MATRQRKRSLLSRLTLPAGAILCVVYFAFHAFHGEYGIYARQRLEQEAVVLARELATARAEHDRLEQRISLLKPSSLDPDMIDERARSSLNMAHPDEIVILRTAR